MFQVKDINFEDWESYNFMVVVKPYDDDCYHFYMVYDDLITADRVANHIGGFLLMTSEVEAI